jgi:hypothetical protein
VGFVDYRAGPSPPDGKGRTPEQLAQIAVEVTRRRACPFFYRFQPGNSPEKHLELQRADQQRRSDRRWDLTGRIVTFLLGTFTGIILMIAKGWYDYFQALRQP